LKTGTNSKFLNAEIGREYFEKFTKIHDHLNAKEEFCYLPKYEVIQKMIDQKYSELFD
jgi:hypothetical protein